MKFNYVMGILGGVLFSAIVLTWWPFMPDSPDLHLSGPPTPRATVSQSNSVSEKRIWPSNPQDLTDDAKPNLTVELPGKDMLERRCLQLAERDPRAAVILAIDTLAYDTHPSLL